MATTVTLITPAASGTGTAPCGIQWTIGGTTRRAVMDSMGWQNGHIGIAWHVENQGTDLAGDTVWEPASSIVTTALVVDTNHYRFLGDGSLRVAPASEALNEDSTVKVGYISEYNFFFGAFGDRSIPIPPSMGINAFIQDAMCRRLNADVPALELAMPG